MFVHTRVYFVFMQMCEFVCDMCVFVCVSPGVKHKSFREMNKISDMALSQKTVIYKCVVDGSRTTMGVCVI